MNSRQGPLTRLIPKNKNEALLIERAKAYCAKLPGKRTEHFKDGSASYFPASLASVIGDQVTAFIRDNERAQYIKAEQVDAIIVGTRDNLRRDYTFPKPIEEILSSSSNWIEFAEKLRNRVVAYMEEGEKIWNTNIPVIVLRLADLTKSQYALTDLEEKDNEKTKRRGQKPG
ncbi:hypothetical protein [Olivibacter domesticus]